MVDAEQQNPHRDATATTAVLVAVDRIVEGRPEVRTSRKAGIQRERIQLQSSPSERVSLRPRLASSSIRETHRPVMGHEKTRRISMISNWPCALPFLIKRQQPVVRSPVAAKVTIRARRACVANFSLPPAPFFRALRRCPVGPPLPLFIPAFRMNITR